MAVPQITAVNPFEGLSAGGELVRLTGTGFAASVLVIFGGHVAQVIGVREALGVSVADVYSPSHDPGSVSVEVHNLDAAGSPVPGESTVVPRAFTFRRPDLTKESDLTRIVRQVLQDLKQQILANTNIGVSVDYDDSTQENGAVAVATVPGIAVSGPDIRENRTYSTNETSEEPVVVGNSIELQRRRSPFTVDLAFNLTCVARGKVERFNLSAEIIKFFNRKLWVEIARDPENVSAGTVKWELSPDGELRSSYRSDGQADSRAFTYRFVIRGVDIDEGLALDRNIAVDSTELQFLRIAEE
jgi:hypothetical protein